MIGKLGGYSPHPMIEHFKFLKAHTRQTPKMTIPSPSSLHFRYGRDAVPASIYPDMADFYRDLGQSYRKAVRAFADAGCRYLQLDEVNLTYLCDPSLRKLITDRGEDPATLPETYAGMINAAISDIPSDMTITMHLCRGNFRSNFVASRRLRAGGRTAVQRRSTCTAISWNMTASAPAASSRCASCRRARPWCSVSSPRRPARWKAKDAIKRRIDEATKFIPLDQLCLSPQCGFASTEEGNVLAEDEQWAKLRMIVELADEVWG